MAEVLALARSVEADACREGDVVSGDVDVPNRTRVCVRQARSRRIRRARGPVRPQSPGARAPP